MELMDKDKKLYRHCVAVLRESVKYKKNLTKSELNEIRKTLGLDFLNKPEIVDFQRNIDNYIDSRIDYFVRGNREYKRVEYEEIKKKNSQLFGHYMKHIEEYTQN